MKIELTLNLGETAAPKPTPNPTPDDNGADATDKTADGTADKTANRKSKVNGKDKDAARERAEHVSEMARKGAAMARKGAEAVRDASVAGVKFARELYAEAREDIAAVRERDPAARDNVEVMLLYSGFHAILAYRVAHRLYIGKHYFPARALSQFARFITGIEIHPGAVIGKRLVIDHGAGVVIGETAQIGDGCTLYQGVTLGGTGKDQGKRHPTLGDNVMIGAGAKVLGPFRIGDNAKIAAGAVVLKEIPDNATAVGIPARIVRRGGVKVAPSDPCADLDQVHVPDPVAQQLSELESSLTALKHELDELKSEREAAKNAPAASPDATDNTAAAADNTAAVTADTAPATEGESAGDA